jgi:GT2 family glycosyltransferase
MNKPLVAVVILNFNGKKLLQQFLPSVIKYSAGCEIYLADNASTDDSLSFIEKEFSQIKRIVLTQNYGFARGYNEALKNVNADYFILLNSDVEVTPDWIEPVIELMQSDESVAACQPKILSYAEKNSYEYAGASGGFIDKYGYPFCRGRIFNELEKDNGQYNDVREIFWASGACMFVKADAYKEAGGFDDSYFAHMEEIDLCWRMKNTGHKIMIVPGSVVFHLGGGTLNKLSSRKTFLNFRNNLITLTKNYPNGNWFFVILVRLVLDGIAGFKFLLEGKPAHMWAVTKAHFSYYFSIGKTLSKRKENKSHKNYKPSYSSIYNGNVVLEFYLRKIKTFSALTKNRWLN